MSDNQTSAFKRKLTNFQRRGERDGEASLDSCMEEIGQFIGRTIATGNQLKHNVTFRKYMRLREVAEGVANLLDAAIFVRVMILEKNAKIVDIPVHRDLGLAQRRIHDAFREGRLPDRGFVYVAWRASPERYFYVGRAASVKRLHLASHGKLARATAEATRLSLLFTKRNDPSALIDLEGSVQLLLRCYVNGAPDYNVTRVGVPALSGQDRLKNTTEFFELLSYADSRVSSGKARAAN